MAKRRKSPRRKSEARSALASSRPRGPGGRFLTKAEIEALENRESVDDAGGEPDLIDELMDRVEDVLAHDPEPVPVADVPSRSKVEEELARLRHAPEGTFASSGGSSGDHSMLERSMKRHERRLRRG